MTSELISLYDGKYSVKNNNGILEVYRHGERWPEKEKQLIGDGFVLALVQALEKMKEAGKDSAEFTKRLMSEYNATPDEWEHYSWLNEWCLNDNKPIDGGIIENTERKIKATYTPEMVNDLLKYNK